MTAPEPEPPAGDDPGVPRDERTRATAAPRSIRRTLASIVLAFEVIVVFLAALVIWGLAREEGGVLGLPEWVPLAGGGVVILGLVLTMGLLRHEWAYGLGWALQVVIFASGVLNPAMFVVGALFGGMWAYCMIVGGRIDRDRAASAAPGREPE
ncbi:MULTISPECIES: DUF4233 domain-containing protein [unclassified Agromyces]|uniref:DUF4233 domain-containing protein n=1 Tax=unclassified Agromyces TaxID=2639701 RepID=UPI003014B435